ncbi:MAG TPA: carboxypeptidase-like regulatory domain-containing protein, partial [Salinimicrobium sp.]|nr:carboxypeptidase-like regulatory domain-containing protein [Salinimicrobium sp.]
MKRLFFIFLLLTAPFMGYSQLNSTVLGSITGTVMDKSLQQPIPYATVTIKTTSGELVTGTISTENGTFSIEKIPYDTYILVVQFMGYKSLKKEILISAEDKKVDLGTIYLEPSVAELEDVVVTAERTTIEQLIDRKVVHVGKDLSTSGASAAEIMNKIPSVRVDMDGNISLRGDGNVRVLVDGKPTNIDAATLLKQIPSSSIEKIELITNPSAKYSPEGMSGIINIVLKKNSRLGFNGVVTGSATLKEHIESDASLNMNYRTGKFNFYTNLGINYGEEEKLGFLNEINGPAEDLTILPIERGQLVKVGVDYYLNDKNVISFYTNQNFIDQELTLITRVTYPENPMQNYTQNIFAGADGLSSTYNFNAKHDFEKEGHNLEFELDYNIYDNDELSEYNFSGNPALESYEDVDNSQRENFIANLDYVNPLTENSKLELGA